MTIFEDGLYQTKPMKHVYEEIPNPRHIVRQALIKNCDFEDELVGHKISIARNAVINGKTIDSNSNIIILFFSGIIEYHHQNYLIGGNCIFY